MIWQPHWSAWKMFSNSRGLAHKSSAFGFDFMIVRHSDIRGTGSTLVSAIRPAKTETIAGVFTASALVTSLTCCSVRIAVTFRAMPSCDNVEINAQVDWPFVLVTGILT